MLGSTEVARRVARTFSSGFRAGIRLIAVSTFSVLAGGNSPCGSLAASTWPVSASARTQAEAGTFGSFLAPVAG